LKVNLETLAQVQNHTDAQMELVSSIQLFATSIHVLEPPHIGALMELAKFPLFIVIAMEPSAGMVLAKAKLPNVPSFLNALRNTQRDAPMEFAFLTMTTAQTILELLALVV
jgi:hypothetical protein